MRSGRPLHLSPVERSVIAWLLVMPLLERRELASIAEWSIRAVEEALRRLERADLVSGIPALLPDMPPLRRFHLTERGIATLAELRSTTTEALLERHPVSAHYINLLLYRLETVALVYRTITLFSEFAGIRAFRWMRKHPLDAVVEFDDGRKLGIIREGPAASPSHFGRRLWSLHRTQRPDTLLAIAPDMLRLRDWRHALGTSQLTSFMVAQPDLLSGNAQPPSWYVPSDPDPWPLSRVYPLVRRGNAPSEPPPVNRITPRGDLAAAARRWLHSNGTREETDHFLPLVLPSGSKRVLTTLHDWPWIALPDLGRMSGITKDALLRALDVPVRLGLVLKVRHHERLRYVLSDRGLRLLARENRLGVPTMLHRWSPSPRNPDEPFSWRNLQGTRLRQLLRDIAHSSAVQRFVAGLAAQTREQGGQVLLMDPPQRAVRRFRSGGQLSSINPDALCVVEVDGEIRHFFLEWERRAEHPSQLRGKLLPYLRYFQSGRPLADYGSLPTLLVALRDAIALTHFLRIARAEIERPSAPEIHVLATHVAVVEAAGPLGKAWTPVARGRPGPMKSERPFPEITSSR